MVKRIFHIAEAENGTLQIVRAPNHEGIAAPQESFGPKTASTSS